ncbi:MAG: cellobiose phosphorylase, partial [Candidatus Aenigmarchaeota archaeon]|nr:cellobiose phosphorylase [Candidatus Aenigmarchaeota archaeon]
IKNHAFTVSSSPEFDQYCQQTFFDNVLRGGMPLVLRTAKGKSIFHLYSRIHGDLERDYHYLILEPTYLSQGNEYYRDVNQNRRTGVWFFPEVEDFNMVTFLDLLQTDGYNPQVVTGLTYTAEDIRGVKKWLGSIVKDKKLFGELLEMVSRPFTPGEFIMKLEGD